MLGKRPWPDARTGAVVVAATVVFACLDVLGAVLGARTTGALGPWAGLALHLAVDAALLAVARAPFAVAGVVIAGTLAVAVAPGLFEPVPAIVGGGIVLGPTGAVVLGLSQLRERRRAAWAVIAVLLLLAVRPWAPAWDTLLLGLLNTLVPALIGRNIDARRRVLEGLREQARRSADAARAQERRRLAAEMHDVVAHRVSLMVLQAGALEVQARDGPTREAAASLRDAGVAALDELRAVVAVLHGDAPAEPEAAPPEPGAVVARHSPGAAVAGPGFGPAVTGPGAGAMVAGHGAGAAVSGPGAALGASPRVGPEAPQPDVRALVAGARAAGLQVELAESGDPSTVAPPVARAAHRVVQEALTNVAKHAPGAAAHVSVAWGAEVVAHVRNTAGAADPALAASGAGSGLRGLAERVTIIGGELAAGPDANGGFAVLARLPNGKERG